MFRTNKFNISAYSISFDSIFTEKEVEDEFYTFLKQESNTEPFLCVKAIQQLSTISSSDEKAKRVEEIINKFIVENSKMEVNLGRGIKLELFSELNEQLGELEWKLKKTPSEIFEPVERSLKMQMLSDNFPRFIRSDHVQVFQKYVNNPKVMKLAATLKYPFNDEYFEIPFATRSEFNFLNGLFEDSFAWNLKFSRKHFSYYESDLNYLPNVSLFHHPITVKFQMTLPYPLKKVASYMLRMHYLNTITPFIVDFEVEKKFTIEEMEETYPEEIFGNPLNSFIGTTYMAMPSPMEPVKSMDVHSLQMEEGSLIFMRKPYFGDYKGMDLTEKMKFENFSINLQKEKKTVEGLIGASMLMIKFTPIDEESTMISYISSNFIF
jgi:hypothetical protein